MEEEHDDQQPEQEEEEDQHQVLHTDGVHAVSDWLASGGGEEETAGLEAGHVLLTAHHASHHHLVGGEGLEPSQVDGGDQRVEYLMWVVLKCWDCVITSDRSDRVGADMERTVDNLQTLDLVRH